MAKVTISKETLQKLLDNFYEACSLCDEMDIYEFEEGDESMQEMKSWADKKFGRKIDKENYD
jgi:nitrate/TMAO reductase-like tetraheme cytochrome c subunit